MVTTSTEQTETKNGAHNDPSVVLSVAEGVATVGLNRPTKLNSLTSAMHAELRHTLDAAAKDPNVRCVVLTGLGRGFCAGQDLADIHEGCDLGQLLSRDYHPLIRQLRALPVPTLAAVNGIAAGAGAGIALMCDVVLAASSASFTFSFAKIGLVPDSGLTWTLPRLVGLARARALFMLGDKLTAADAQACGLIWRTVDDGSFEATVRETARSLASSSAAAIVATRLLVDGAQDRDLLASLGDEVSVQRDRGYSADYREGVQAFLEKRRAHFVERLHDR